ncbi:MAG: methyltransferase domain-containing protein [Acidimicrobiales bacterium]
MKTPPLDPSDLAEHQELDAVAGQFLISVGDVVALSGRPPWAVAQWRKRVADPFPEPVEGGRSPQFNAAQVLDWLRSQRDSKQALLPPGEPRPAWFWNQAAALLPGATSADERQHLRVYVAALVTLGAALRTESRPSQRGTGRALDATAADLNTQAKKVEQRRPDLRGLLVANLTLVTPKAEVLATLTLTLDHALRPPARDGSDIGMVAAGLLDDALDTLTELAATAPTTHPLVADITGKIARHWPATRALDAACGEGVLLAELARRHPDLELVGVDLDEAAAATARLRLGLRAANAEVRNIDALLTDDLRDGGFDIAVLDPPAGDLGPWVELMSDALTAQGHAVVALRATSLRGSAESLVAHRQTAAVVLLPASVRQGGRDTQALAVVSRTGGHDTILVVDLSHLRPPVLKHGQSEQIGSLVAHWLMHPDASEAERATFSDETGLRSHLVEARRAERTSLVDLIEPEPDVASEREVRAAVAKLEDTLSRCDDVEGADELRTALAAFSRANRTRRHR